MLLLFVCSISITVKEKRLLLMYFSLAKNIYYIFYILMKIEANIFKKFDSNRNIQMT